VNCKKVNEVDGISCICVPSDLLAGGEIKEHWSLKNVDLILLGAADTIDCIIYSFKFYQSLSDLRHHCKIATKKLHKQVSGK